MMIILPMMMMMMMMLFVTIDSSRYDKSAILFSPDGDLLQVEYAEKAAKKGAPLIACCSNDIIVLCSPTSSNYELLDRRYIDKISEVWDGLWMCSTGLQGDGKALLREARTYCVDFKSQFGCAPSASALSRHIGQIKHQATLTGGKRPYGVETLIIGYDEDNNNDPKLFMCKSSGYVSQWKAIAVGKESDKALSLLENEYKTSMSINILTKLIIDILKKTDNTIMNNGIDIYIIKQDNKNTKKRYPRLHLIENVKDDNIDKIIEPFL